MRDARAEVRALGEVIVDPKDVKKEWESPELTVLGDIATITTTGIGTVSDGAGLMAS